MVKDLTIIWNGQILIYKDVTNVSANKDYVTFRTADDHNHSYHNVPYHLETYWPDTGTQPNMPASINRVK